MADKKKRKRAFSGSGFKKEATTIERVFKSKEEKQREVSAAEKVRLRKQAEAVSRETGRPLERVKSQTETQRFKTVTKGSKEREKRLAREGDEKARINNEKRKAVALAAEKRNKERRKRLGGLRRTPGT